MGHAQVSLSFDGVGKFGNRFPAREESEGLWLIDWEIWGFWISVFQVNVGMCLWIFRKLERKNPQSLPFIYIHIYHNHIAERYIRINQSIKSST